MNSEIRQFEKPIRKDFSRLAFGVLAMMAVWYAVNYAVSYGLLYLEPELLNLPLVNWIINDVSLYLFGLPVLLLILRRVEKAPLQRSGFGIGRLLVGLLIALCVMMIGNIFSLVLINVYQAVTGYTVDNSMAEMVNSTPLWQVFLFTVVIAPIGEEFVFRRCLCDRLKKYGDITAILVSSWMFGCFHGNVFQIVYAFSVGCVLSYVYLRSGKLRYSVMIHAGINFLSGFLTSALSRGVDLTNVPANMMQMLDDPTSFLRVMLLSFYTIVLYGSAFAGLILLIVFLRQLRFDKGMIAMPASRKLSVSVFNIGSIVLAVGFAAAIILNLILQTH